MRAFLLSLAAWCICIATWSASAERLVVFVDGGGSALQQAFAEEQVPALRELGEELGVTLEVFDVAQRGATPQGVGLTPMIAFQNWRGTSIYQGRYTTLDRVKNFVRTSRFQPQGDAPFVRESVPLRELGRMKLAVPIKVTAFAGPGGVEADTADFRADLPNIIAAGMPGFALAERVELGRSDRSWYADFHPYVSEDGTLYVSTELYSQFHCHEPVKSWLDVPVSGPIADRDAVFAQAAARIEAEITRQLAESQLGDGFDVVAVPSVSWEQAGLPLPAKPAQADADVAADFAMPGSWTVDVSAQESQPAVQFTWPPPVDAYSGEATELNGNVRLGGDATNGWRYADLTGRFIVDPKSVTMGEPDLDAYIHSGVLEVGAYPEASFSIQRVEVQPAFADQPVTLGELVPVTLRGIFTMKGVAIPLTVPMSVEAFVGDDGRPRLSLTGQWTLPLDAPWNIEGPPGPKAASNLMKFACRIVLEPAE